MTASLRPLLTKFGLASRAPLELDARAKLLAAVHRGAPMGIAASVVLPVLTLAAFWDSGNRLALAGWCLIMLCLTASGLRFYFGYRYDMTRMTLAAHTRKWWTGMRIMSAVGGLAWGSSAGLYLVSPSLEFSSLLMIVIIGVAAGAVLSQAPVPSNLLILGTGILTPHFALAEQAFPEHGLYVRGVLLFFAAFLARHAANIHSTLVREIQLENESRQLARRYQDEKQRALSASEEKSRFLAAASHDLRQPVHALVLLVEALRARNQSESLAPLVEQLASGAQTIDLLFRSLLDLSKLESRKTSPTLEPVDLGEVITEVVQQFLPDARAKGLTLTQRIPPLPVFGMAEPVLLRRALFNLLQNALRYTSHGGVMVTLRVRQKHLRIEVWDTGIGIAPEHQKDIFSSYYQVENPERDPSQGLGLGLAIYKECVRLLRGTFGVRSVPGRGSMFWMALRPVPADITRRWLPSAAQRAEAGGAGSAALLRRGARGGRRCADPQGLARAARSVGRGSAQRGGRPDGRSAACARPAAADHLLRPAPARQGRWPAAAGALAGQSSRGPCRAADRRSQLGGACPCRGGGLPAAGQADGSEHAARAAQALAARARRRAASGLLKDGRVNGAAARGAVCVTPSRSGGSAPCAR